MIRFGLEALVVVAAILDVRSRRIPNWLTLPGIIAGIAANTWLQGWAGLKLSLLGFGAASLVYGVLFALRAMGGGDVKLMAAIGAFSGPDQWFVIFVLTSILGGVFALVTLLVRGGLGRVLRNIGVILWSLVRLRSPHVERPELDVTHAAARTLPHGAAIAAGTLIYLVLVSPAA